MAIGAVAMDGTVPQLAIRVSMRVDTKTITIVVMVRQVPLQVPDVHLLLPTEIAVTIMSMLHVKTIIA